MLLARVEMRIKVVIFSISNVPRHGHEGSKDTSERKDYYRYCGFTVEGKFCGRDNLKDSTKCLFPSSGSLFKRKTDC